MLRLFRFILVLIAIIIPGIPFTIVVPLFPLQIARRGMGQIYSGLALSALSIGAFIMPVVLVKCLLPKIGRLRSAILGYVIAAISSLILGVAQRITHNVTFGVVSILARIFEGASASLSYAAITMIISTYSRDSDSAILTVFLAQSIAQTSGPLLGGLLYTPLGYVGVFVLLAVMLLLSGILFYALYYQEADRYEIARSEVDRSRLGLWDVLKKPGPLFNLLNFYLAETILNDIDPILPYKLHGEFDFTERSISLFFLSFVLTSTLCGMLLMIVPDHVNKQYFTLPGNLIAAIGFLLLGPSPSLQFPDNFQLMRAGMIVCALGRSLIFYFAVSQTIKKTMQAYPNDKEKGRELASSLAEMSLAIGYLVAPLLVSALFQSVEFEKTLEFLGIFHFLFFLVYCAYFIVDWKMRKKRERKEREERERKERNKEEIKGLLEEGFEN